MIQMQKTQPRYMQCIVKVASLNRLNWKWIYLFMRIQRILSLYELTWWNGKEQNICNTIAIKNKTITLDAKAIKEKYYMRLCAQEVADWEWYDNDGAYKQFKDYQSRDKHMLLHKQLEATFQSNLDTNYPWTYFERDDDHSFNNAQVTHLKLALEDHDLYLGTQGYLVQFRRLHASDRWEFDLNVILNVQQIDITNEGTIFSRNIRRMVNGTNSLSLYYTE
eukprot:295000_1